MTKKEQQEMNRAKRNLWPMNPVTRIKESGKVYRRKKLRAAEYQDQVRE